MKIAARFRKPLHATILCCSLMLSHMVLNNVHAQAVWHCSRMPEMALKPVANTAANVVSETAAFAVQEEFKLSSFDAISVTLEDLLDVYLGHAVKIGQFSLNACFMPGDGALSQDALQSLGLKSQVMQKISARSAIVQSRLHVVNDEQQMLQCMERHFPAFGYLSKEVISEKVVPCF